MSRERISNVDLALLRMDDPKNLMIITSLMIFDTPLEIQGLKQTIQRAFLCYPRFRQRIVEPISPLRKPYWQDDHKFDLDNHIERIDLKLPENQSLLEHLIGELMSLPLDPKRPLWKFFLVENYGKGSALIARLHHSIADGIALTRVLLSMTETSPNTMKELTIADLPCNDKNPSKALKEKQSAFKLPKNIIRKSSKALKNPITTATNARQDFQKAIAMGRFVARSPDPKTVLKGELDGKKLAVWSQPISLSAIKGIGRTYNATVNDVLLSIVAGALREYLLGRGESVDTGDLHSFIPVNLRPQDLYNQLGNQFGLVFLNLPVDIADSLERLRKTKQNMDELKNSPEAFATIGLFYLLGAAPGLQKVALNIFDSKGTAVTTNVPGPQHQLYLAGAPINTVMAWVPKSGHVGLGISIISYNGQVWMGVTTDAGLVPDPETISDLFQDSFQELLSRTERERHNDQSDLAPALKKLNQALDSLDELLIKDKRSNGNKNQQQEAVQTDQCKALTKSSKPCKNKTSPGESYCRVHRKNHVQKAMPV